MNEKSNLPENVLVKDVDFNEKTLKHWKFNEVPMGK